MATAGLVNLGTGIAAGISGGRRQSQINHDYEVQRNMAQDLSNQSGTDYYNQLAPTQYAYNQLAFHGGYSPEEQQSLYQTPEEQQAQYLNPNGLFYTQAEQDAQRIGDPEAQNITNQALSPIAGAASRAAQHGAMAAAARGSYAPGLNATLEEVNRQQGRTAGDVAMQTGLGIAGYNRAANLNIANQRVNTQQGIEEQRAGTAADLARRRTATATGIGEARMGQQQFGATGLANLAGLSSGRQLTGLQQRGAAVNGEAGQPGAVQAGIGAFQQAAGTFGKK